MAVQLPNNITLALATAYGPVHVVSAVTNADPAVATTTTPHGIDTGALIEVSSGWSKIDGQIVRVAAAAGSALSYEDVDTTSVSRYTPGSGAGSVREITEFTQISEVLTLASSGGDMQFVQYTLLDGDSENQLPNQTNAQALTIEISDDASLPGYQALRAASRSGEVTALKMTFKNGSFILYNGYVSLNETPTISKGAVMSVKATLSLQAAPVRYPA